MRKVPVITCQCHITWCVIGCDLHGRCGLNGFGEGRASFRHAKRRGVAPANSRRFPLVLTARIRRRRFATASASIGWAAAARLRRRCFAAIACNATERRHAACEHHQNGQAPNHHVHYRLGLRNANVSFRPAHIVRVGSLSANMYSSSGTGP